MALPDLTTEATRGSSPRVFPLCLLIHLVLPHLALGSVALSGMALGGVACTLLSDNESSRPSKCKLSWELSTSSDLNLQKAKLLKQVVGQNRPCMLHAVMVMVLMLIRQGRTWDSHACACKGWHGALTAAQESKAI